jgi:hypothetical protein
METVSKETISKNNAFIRPYTEGSPKTHPWDINAEYHVAERIF